MRFKRIRSWLRRQKKIAGKNTGPLREFVYLDETSVHSLLASRLGPIAVEFTETEQATLSAEVQGQLGTNIGIGTAQVSSGFSGSQTQGTQVLRRAIAQSTFRDLYAFEEDKLALSPRRSQLSAPAITDASTWLSSEAAAEWAIPARNLKRGQLIEVEVELETDDAFRVGTVLSSILQLVDQNAAMFGSLEQEGLRTGRGISKMLEILLAGLVPLRGRAVDYASFSHDGELWLVRNEVIPELQRQLKIEPVDVFVVGVAETRMFWKDLRRILFSKLRYRAFCRLSVNGLLEKWTPVKLAHVLAPVLPNLGDQIDEASRMALSGLALGGGLNPTELDQKARLKDALGNYAKSVRTHYGWSNAPSLADIESLAEPISPHDLQDYRIRRDLFANVDNVLSKASGQPVEPLVAVELRSSALLGAGLWIDGQALPFAGATAEVEIPTKPARRYLDAEFVAIYW